MKEILDFWSKGKKALAILLIAFAIHGTAGFICFISEEAMQTAMFGAFAYCSAEDWDGLEQHIKVMESTHSISSAVIYIFGWFSPLSFPAYISYLEVNQAYIDSMKMRASKRK